MEQLKLKIARWLGRKIEKYQEEAGEVPEFYLPETTEDLLWVLKKTPESALSTKQRERIASVMSFDERKVAEVMIPRDKVTFVYENDFLGPLMLDKLYQSGFSHFPVLSTKGDVVGVLHTESLNRLEIKDTDRAGKYVDGKVFYVRSDYSLPQAMAAFVRTNSNFLLVINDDGNLVGLIDFGDLVEFLTGEKPVDDFDEDGNIVAVAKR